MNTSKIHLFNNNYFNYCIIIFSRMNRAIIFLTLSKMPHVGRQERMDRMMAFWRTEPSFFLSIPPKSWGKRVSHALDKPTRVENEPMLMKVLAKVTAASSFGPIWPQKNRLTIGKNVWLKLLKICNDKIKFKNF